MKIGLVGPSYVQRSLPFDAQRTVNLYPILDDMGKEVAALYGTPGKSLFTTAGFGPIRGEFASTNGRAFCISGSVLYEIDSAGNVTNHGSLDSSSGVITTAENGPQLAICDGEYLYIFTYATNAFEKVTDPDIPTQIGMVAYIDGYFVINEVDTGRFYISALNDGLAWDALDFATAEGSPDNLIAVVNAVGQLWLFGSQTTEIWSNTGDSDFPFRRIAGAKMETGIVSPYSAIQIDNSIIWVGKDIFGQGMVYKAQGFSPIRISTTPIEKRIQEANNLENISAYAYQEEGNTFYVLTGGGLETTLVYDLVTQQWHERAYLNSDGDFEQDIASCHMFIFGRHLVGDRRNGKIYTQSLDFYDDGGEPLVRERTYTHLSDEEKRIRYNVIKIGFETGVGLQTGQGSNPLVSLRLSKDGARTWSDYYTTTMGAVGKYETECEFRRLGVAQQMTFQIRVSDPVKVAIIGSYLQ
ncbi:MAG: hypothetical protein E6R03_01305 [Hyphomicrobiaceae bacterium]|nr:MAG: hypothetical protein E6R03_01305 [Hyphomicrobiaceae bacterium]